MIKRVVASLIALAAATQVTPARAEGDDVPLVPVFRIALGPAIHVAPKTEEQVELGLDVTAGAMVMIGDDALSLIVDPELGYAFDSLGIHAFNLTCGVGLGSPLAALLYQPRLILGTGDGELAVGMRNGLGFHVLADLGSLEIGHQFVHLDGGLHHDVRVMFGVNPAAFVFLVMGLSEALR
jgi:hypothetical protein